jgi:hypothetical protein
VYDIAFLAGGAARMVDTAVVALVRAGRVRIHAPGQLVTADLSRRHPVEAAVLDAVGPTGHRSVDTVRWRLHDDERLLEVGRRLRQAGLLGRVGAAIPVMRGDRRALAPTRAGRRTLHALREQPAGVDAELLRVALGGRAAMTDEKLRAGIFERPVTTLAPPSGRRSRHDIDHSDPHLAAYRTGGMNPAIGGHVGHGGFDGGGFDGGGFDGGGFDGGAN